MKGILCGLAIVVPMWIVILWVVVGCAPTPVTRYESDPNHYPYYREADPARAETGFYPHTNPGVIVGGPRNGSVVYNGKVYHDDGTMDFLGR